MHIKNCADDFHLTKLLTGIVEEHVCLKNELIMYKLIGYLSNSSLRS